MTSRRDYIRELKGLCQTHLLPLMRAPATTSFGNYLSRVHNETTVEIRLVLIDNSQLNILMSLGEVNGDVEIVTSTYEYIRPSGFFFKYEKERTPQTTPARSAWKPYPHLHVGVKREVFIADSEFRAESFDEIPPELRFRLPHYKSADITVQELIAMIVQSFDFEDAGLPNAHKQILLATLGYPIENPPGISSPVSS